MLNKYYAIRKNAKETIQFKKIRQYNKFHGIQIVNCKPFLIKDTF